jgi:hypothetical protein
VPTNAKAFDVFGHDNREHQRLLFDHRTAGAWRNLNTAGYADFSACRVASEKVLAFTGDFRG